MFEKERIPGKESSVKVAVCQMSLEFGKKEENTAKTIEWIGKAADNGANLIVLPELCNTGYAFNTREQAFALAEEIPAGPTTQAWAKVARERGVYVAAGIPEAEGNCLYNSAVLVGPEGYIGKFRKLHLYNEEKLFFEPGNLGIPVYKTKIGRIAMLICFDAWFPETWRIAAIAGADIVCTPVNWVKEPSLPDDTQTFGHFVSMVASNCNGIFVAAADRVGYERGITFPGRSLITNPSGMPSVGPGSPTEEEILYADCNLVDARKLRWNNYNTLLHDRRVDFYGKTLGADFEPFAR